MNCALCLVHGDVPNPATIHRPVREFPGYFAGTNGTIVSSRYGRALKPHLSAKGGYHFVSLYRGGKQFRRSVHSLVLAAYRGPRPTGLVSLHSDGNPTHNCLSNLDYGTYSQNAQDRLRHGRDRNARKTSCKRGHEFTLENTRFENGTRRCRACHRDLERERRQR